MMTKLVFLIAHFIFTSKQFRKSLSSLVIHRIKKMETSVELNVSFQLGMIFITFTVAIIEEARVLRIHDNCGHTSWRSKGYHGTTHAKNPGV